MKKLFLFVVLIGMMAIGVGTAQAHVQGGDIDTVWTDGSGNILGITGSITCTSHESYTIRVNVSQSDGDTAVGRAHGVCDGTPQQWQTTRVDSTGPFEVGPAAGHLQARTQPDGASKSINDKAQVKID
jgi:hypothetical protein